MNSEQAIKELEQSYRPTRDMASTRFNRALDLALSALRAQQNPEPLTLDESKETCAFIEDNGTWKCNKCGTEWLIIGSLSGLKINPKDRGIRYCPGCGRKLVHEPGGRV